MIKQTRLKSSEDRVLDQLPSLVINTPTLSSGQGTHTEPVKRQYHANLMTPESSKPPKLSRPSKSSLALKEEWDMEEYLELSKESDTIDQDIDSVDRSLARIESEWEQQRANITAHIDDETPRLQGKRRKILRAKQDKEMEDLQARHNEDWQRMCAEQGAEVKDLKEKYAVLKCEHNQERKKLLEQRDVKLQRKRAVEDDIKRNHNDFTKEQLLAALREQKFANKRRNIAHEMEQRL
ncbi:hypothetical protein GQ44DRAFT_702876 [Phaeosphaeriaceae sp. PMI808]|nr:hypothetical protein GQ44DRAFT_702876 [Phaeosphaeriaceae sp. PMI808]